MAVVTTGFFDGVHLGHCRVIEKVVSCARERGEEAIVVTFWPHPRAVLQQDARDFRLLSSLDEKRARILSLGVDRVEVLPFTRSFASLTAFQYIDMLKERFGASLIVMGYDNRIGSDKKTVVEVVSAMAPAEFVIPGPDSESFHGGAISSTRIREAVSAGRVQDAGSMLGYEYSLYGVVVAGNRLGRTIGFPTANMQLYEPLKLVPSNGVYAVDVEVLGSTYRGMTNIGTRPTVGGSARTIETHILDFDQEIYGLPVKLSFRERIRDERKFPSLEELRIQLEKDRANCI